MSGAMLTTRLSQASSGEVSTTQLREFLLSHPLLVIE
jgi:hypothetical protein